MYSVKGGLLLVQSLLSPSPSTAEPDGYANGTVPASQLAKDFEFLKSLVANKSPATQFIAGPDVASVNQFFVRYVFSLIPRLSHAQEPGNEASMSCDH